MVKIQFLLQDLHVTAMIGNSLDPEAPGVGSMDYD